jgi:hypothetical protein
MYCRREGWRIEWRRGKGDDENGKVSGMEEKKKKTGNGSTKEEEVRKTKEQKEQKEKTAQN